MGFRDTTPDNGESTGKSNGKDNESYYLGSGV